MDYIYDIVLNFQEEYYDFYEWKSTDKIINVNRLPIYKISNESYLTIKNSYTTIDKSSLPKQNKMFLLTNDIEVMALIVDNTGKVLKKSSLLFEESDDILEDKELIKSIDLKYTINKKNKLPSISRLSQEKTTYLSNYLKNIDPAKDEYLLKYIYYELHQQEEPDPKKIYTSLLDLSKTNPTKLYTSIKQVNLELKR